MDKQIIQDKLSEIRDDLELVTTYSSGNKVIGIGKIPGEKDAYEKVVVYDPKTGNTEIIHFMTALIDYPESK